MWFLEIEKKKISTQRFISTCLPNSLKSILKETLQPSLLCGMTPSANYELKGGSNNTS
jgi:hypothetical protein